MWESLREGKTWLFFFFSSKNSEKLNWLCGESIIRGGGESEGKQAMWALVTS